MVPQENIDGYKIQVKNNIATLSNLISFSRALIPIPLIILHQEAGQQTTTWITVLLLYALISDYLDGLAARKLNQVTELGKVMDPVADKVCASILFLYTTVLGMIPVWFFVALIGRDLLIVLGSLRIKRRRGKVAMSTWSGKIAVNLLSLYWLAVFYQDWLESVLTEDMRPIILSLKWLTLITLTYSTFSYGRRYFKIQRGAEYN